MAQFLYYRAGVGRVTQLSQVQELGLGYAFERPPTCCGTQQGPDGQAGQTFAQEGDRLGYYPDRQTWKRIPGSECWVGHENDALPGPQDLARAEQLDGHLCEFEDGQRWLIPCARRWSEHGIIPRVALPMRYTLNDAGDWTLAGIKKRYEPLWRLVVSYERAELAAVKEGEEGPFTFEFPELHDLCLLALQVNYRVGPAEVDLLQIYDSDSCDCIVDAVIDRPTWILWAQKKSEEDRAGTSSSSGPEPPKTDNTTDISQPSQS